MLADKKIILVNLQSRTYKAKSLESEIGYNPSFALISLGTWLELNGYQPIIIDLCCEELTMKEFLEQIICENPILIGFSIHTENVDIAISSAKVIKKYAPNIRIVAGGPHPSLVPDEIIDLDCFDFVIRKEGESSLLELVEAISSNEILIKYDNILGLIFKRNSKVLKNKLRANISDLDILPILKRELTDISRYNGVVNIITSRGCPGNCIYCAAHALSGVTYRPRDIENVFLEIVLIRSILKDKLTKIYIVDDTFTAIPERIKKFTNLLKENNMNTPWKCQSRVDIMNEELLTIMADSGCTEILYGIESGSQEVLEKIRKGINLEQAEKVIKETCNRQIIPELSFIIGHYCDTRDTMEKTYLFIKEVYDKFRAEISIYFNTPYPGTWQYINREKLGMRIIETRYNMYNNNTPIIETDNISVYDQREAYYKISKYCIRRFTMSIIKKTIRKNL